MNPDASTDRGDGPPHEPTFAEGVEHLQSAANELIEAARTFLNVVEDVVADRDKLQAATAGLADLVGSAGDALTGLIGRAASNGAASRATAASGAPAGPTRGVRRIELDDE